MVKNILKLFVLSFALFIGFANAQAQIYNPVKWDYKSTSLGDNEFELQFIATIEAHWHLYSQHVSQDGPNGSPIPTGFFFKESADYELIGKTKEPEGVTIDDPVFQMTLTYFENKAVFTQRVKILSEKTTITGDMEYMSCDDSKCLPPEFIPFSFELKGEPVANQTESNIEKEETAGAVSFTVSNESSNQNNNSGIHTPVTWKTRVISLGNDEYELQAIASIEEHWHLYSMDLPSEDGPVATEFVVLDSTNIEFVGTPTETGDVIEEYDPNFDMDLSYYADSVVLSQRIKTTEEKLTINAEVYFMACDANTCIPPEAVELTFEFEGEPKSWLSIIVLSFLGGLAALLTPCVFPMIPMTVSFFTKQSKTKAEGVKNAIIYGLSIIGIYVLLGVGVSSVFGADALNEMSTNMWFNIFFFILLVVFAISFLGAFEITLPSSWVNKADANADKGGIIGIFFMAFVLALVSFSCTGPIIGTLLVQAASEGYLGPIIGMLSFSTALALPFALFAMFPGWMNSLPKSGGWLNTVKVVLGFLELALAFKFLSNADLVHEAGYLEREAFIAIWITVFGALAIYLFGWIKLPHDSPLDGISVGRLLTALTVTWFVIYLIPGMWGAPLKLISGFPPPANYSESPNGVGYKSTIYSSSGAEHKKIPKGADPDHCPHGLNCFHDYEEGLKYAKEVGLPVFIDFTGKACVNCRKMEGLVWSDSKVLNLLRNEFVLISLYVDQATELPIDEQYVSKTGKKIKTVGNKWSDFQITRYKTNAQPYYVILDHNEKQLHESAAYDPDIPKFVDWLERGIKIFNKGK